MVTVWPFDKVEAKAFVGRTPHSRIVGAGTDFTTLTPVVVSSQALNWYLPPSGVDL